MNNTNLRRRSYFVIAAMSVIVMLLAIWRVDSLNASQALQATEIQARKVKLETVKQHSLTEWAFADGTVQAARREYLQLETTGIVTELGSVDGKLLREGQTVKGPSKGSPGDLLMRIDVREQSAELNAILAQVIEARTAKEQAEREFKRAEKIYQRQLISQNDFEASRTARDARRAAYNAALAQRDRSQVSLDKAILRAPFDGIITRVNVREGDYYTGAKPAASDDQREINAAIVLMDTDQFEATLNLPLWNGTQVKSGQRVYLATSNSVLAQAAENDFSKGAFATGIIESISPSISLDKRAVMVKVLTLSGEEYLRDGAFVTAWIVTRQRDGVLAIPDTAITDFESGNFVYVYDADRQVVQQRSLTLGGEGLELLEVLDGLEQGEKIVVGGGELLTDGTPVIVIGE